MTPYSDIYLDQYWFRWWLVCLTASSHYLNQHSDINGILWNSKQSRGRLDINMASYQYRDPILKIRRSRERLIFNMGILITGKTVFVLRRAPGHTTYLIWAESHFTRSNYSWTKSSVPRLHLSRGPMSEIFSYDIWPAIRGFFFIISQHRRNTPSARVPLLTAPSAGSIYLFAQFPTPTRVLLSRGLSGGSSKPPTHCSRQAFEATFDKLQLIRTTLISKMIKTW